ncbi:RNA polymerase subunit sigma-70 [Flavipsychrobacter stenotrophus]|uniref:RNA polymerase subunit sigma-70 n=1 Tax=Flavipsychrobacter stenotrophus TaxID=2077091 RepID=A0A2S7SSE0_9BACT|nr:sigma-70 family RNA polymerase sigma factor [Flavipsychrobacter stenotrophus]PQJ09823.1 RNA polymerase subunit sigma-70 [Flavipsychrobacter stenotrophus]
MYSATNNDQQLLRALAKGERVATEQIYKQQFPIINSWLIKNGGSTDDAADLFQEAMVVLFSKVQNEDFALTCAIGTYLFSISKHLWYKRLQQQQKGPGRLYDNTEDDGAEVGIAYEEDINVHHEREVHFNQLDTALDQIGEPCRSLLKAYYHKDKSMQEIAADFGYTNPENAKTQKYKCLTRLRKLFYSVQAK